MIAPTACSTSLGNGVCYSGHFGYNIAVTAACTFAQAKEIGLLRNRISLRRPDRRIGALKIEPSLKKVCLVSTYNQFYFGIFLYFDL